MFIPEDGGNVLQNANYAAYSDAMKVAFRTLSDCIAEYYSKHRELYDNENLEVPTNFRPLHDYERTLKIQKLTLRLALQAAKLSESKVADFGAALSVQTNGHGTSLAEGVC